MLKIQKNIILVLIFLIILNNCGYKVIDKSQFSNLKVESFLTEGDNKLNFLIKNNLQKVLGNNQGDERVYFKLKTVKEKEVREKNDSNRITKYQIKIITTVMLNFLDTGKTQNFNISVIGNYDVSDNHSTTINNQNDLEKNLSDETADLIIRELILRINDN
tara:strand:- start:268 stop:750 length:483 start_codon:yes stop_codon:yes gene_type:complete